MESSDLFRSRAQHVDGKDGLLLPSQKVRKCNPLHRDPNVLVVAVLVSRRRQDARGRVEHGGEQLICPSIIGIGDDDLRQPGMDGRRGVWKLTVDNF